MGASSRGVPSAGTPWPLLWQESEQIMTEFEVYQQLIAFLTSARWTIVCASPPGGTDNRYHKCILPREDWAGSEKGLRDEVDLIAHDGSVVLLVECKATLRDSLTVLNTYGES